MKLIVPHMGKLEGRSARLIRLAEFLGISCEPILLEKGILQPAKYLQELVSDHKGCFVVDPEVMSEWTGGHLPVDLPIYLAAHFPFLLVHGVSSDSFSQELTRALSGGRLHSVSQVKNSGASYKMAPNLPAISGAFCGLSFGPVNTSNDCVFCTTADRGSVRTPISIGDSPFMAAMNRDKAEMVFLASADCIDLSTDVADKRLGEYFSRFVPYAMALRYMFGQQCWHATDNYASFIIDDPLLRSRYGYVDFRALLTLMKTHKFSTTIAFIPHNYRRSSKSAVKMFRQNRDRLAICFHGNDHTAAEFASSDIERLNTMVQVAEGRMDIHANATGLHCDKVMVFPQEKFSPEAMNVLKSCNFFAAVNATPNPAGRKLPLTIAEIARPAILRYQGFPLFIRKYIGEAKPQDIAFDVFFGKPVLAVEHHEVFKRPDSLIDTVRMINSVAPAIRWCNLETTIINSNLRRRGPKGCCHIQAYSSTTNIVNDSDSPQRIVTEWNHPGNSPFVEEVLLGNTPSKGFEIDDSTIRCSLELPPRTAQTASVVYRNEYPRLTGFGFRWGARAFIRRRLSELRDNYVSKNRFATAIGQNLRRRMFPKSL